MKVKSIFRAMTAIVLMLAVSFNAQAQTNPMQFSSETVTPPQPWELSSDIVATFANGVLTIKGNPRNVRIDGKDKVLIPDMPHFKEKNPRPWGAIRNEIKTVILKDVKSVGDCAFMGCENLTTVKMGKEVTWIYDRAFAGCTSLTEVNGPKEFERIGTDAFAGCTSLNETAKAISDPVGFQIEITNGTKFNINIKSWVHKDGSVNLFDPLKGWTYIAAGKTLKSAPVISSDIVAFEAEISGDVKSGSDGPFRIPINLFAQNRYLFTGTDKTNVKIVVNTYPLIGFRNELPYETIVEMYVRASGTNDWGPDRLRFDIRPNSFSDAAVYVPSSISKKFDIRIITNNNREYVLRNCNVDNSYIYSIKNN